MTYYDRDAGTMTYHPTHSHMHVDNWGVYSLRADNGDPNPLNWPIVGDGAKLAFCLMDYGSCSTYNGHCVDANNNVLVQSNFPNFGLGGGAYNCSQYVQGISSGYTDIYYQYLDGMYIDIPPGTCNGNYYIVVHLDPLNYFLEENENNNTIVVPYTLTKQSGTIPTVSASGPTNFCTGGSVTLTSSAATNYLWSNGATTQSITISNPGNYSVTTDQGSACPASSATTTVTTNTLNVTASASSSSICEGTTIQLNSSATGSGTATQAVAFTNSTQVFIPDNNSTGVTSTIAVSGINPATLSSGTIASVRLNLTHTYDNDLIISLIAPSGNTIQLSNRRGGSGDNFTNTLFIASATTAIASGSAPFNGSYRPDQAFSTLTGNVNGNWQLRVQDVAGTDTGRIQNWTITFNNQVASTLSYNWATADGFTSNVANTSHTPTVPTTYNLTVTESGTGCTGTQAVSVNVTPTPTVAVTGGNSICAGESTILGASGATSFSWSPAAGLNSTNSSTVTAAPANSTTYTITGTTNGCSGTAMHTVNVNQLPTASSTTQDVNCNGGNNGSIAINASNGTTPYSYNWTPGGNLGSNASGLTAGSYQIDIADANGCTHQMIAVVNQPTAMNASLNVTNGTCLGNAGSIDLTVYGGVSPYSFNWSNGSSSEDINGLAPGTYTCTITDANNCTNVQSTNITSSGTAPAVPVNTTATTLICRNNTATFSVANQNGVSFNWTVPSTLTITGGQGSNTITVNVSNTAVANTVSVNASNACGTSNATTIAYTVTASTPGVPASITSSAPLCQGTTVTMTAAATNNTSIYNWTVPANITIASGQGTRFLVINVGATFTSGAFGVSAGNCVATSAQRIITFSALPTIPSSITGTSQGVCPNSTVTYTINTVNNATGYQWNVPANSTIVTGQGTTSITLNTAANFNGGTLSVSSLNACGSSVARTLLLYSKPNIPSNISGPLNNVCAGTSNVVYSIPNVNGATGYTWSVPAGTTINSGQGSTSINVTFDGNFTGGTMSVVATNGCGSSASRIATIRSAPAQPGAVTGSVYALCNTTNKTYSIAAVTNATAYNWSLPANATITSGQGTNSIQVDFASNYAGGLICVTASNVCGTSAARCFSSVAAPSKPASITGPATACAGQQNLVYTAAAVAGASSYNWTVPAGATITAGQGSSSIMVNMGATAGSIGVRSSNGCANSSYVYKAVAINCRNANYALPYDLDVYPNPASDEVNVRYTKSSNETAQVSLLDITGRKLNLEILSGEAGSTQQVTINTSQLAKGVYLIEVLEAAHQQVSRLVIQ
jgi:subtilisin-like proprotein convertase family protein